MLRTLGPSSGTFAFRILPFSSGLALLFRAVDGADRPDLEFRSQRVGQPNLPRQLVGAEFERAGDHLRNQPFPAWNVDPACVAVEPGGDAAIWSRQGTHVMGEYAADIY